MTGYLLAFRAPGRSQQGGVLRGLWLPGREQEVFIAEHERAILTQDVLEKGVKAGDVGTVVSMHTTGAGGGDRAGYTLEFMSPSGETLAIATVAAYAVRPVGPTRSTTPG